MVIKYQCKNCGDNLIYDANSGMLKCHSCKSEFSLDDFPKDEHVIIQDEDIKSHTSVGQYNKDDIKEYQCKSCGAILVTQSNTSATKCGFCNSYMILLDRVSNNYAPVQVIPFKMNIKTAHKNFKKWCKNGFITPNAFRTLEKVKDIQGIYVPFWLYDLNVKAQAYANCTKVRVTKSGNTETTHTEHYQVYRKVESDYYRLPVDAAEKLSDEYMDKLEPFFYDELKEFNMAYLTGYGAQKYDYSDEDMLPRVKKRVTEYIDGYVRSTINGYNSINLNQLEANVIQKDAVYTLMPIYLLNYRYKNKWYTFAMNGQTGKVVGKPPISIPKVATLFLGITAVSFGLIELGLYLVGAL